MQIIILVQKEASRKQHPQGAGKSPRTLVPLYSIFKLKRYVKHYTVNESLVAGVLFGVPKKIKALIHAQESCLGEETFFFLSSIQNMTQDQEYMMNYIGVCSILKE